MPNSGAKRLMTLATGDIKKQKYPHPRLMVGVKNRISCMELM
jgi:hypothetical protein